MLHHYPPTKSNALYQDIIKFVIDFIKRSGRFDKPLISLKKWIYVLLFLFLPKCLWHCLMLLFVCFVFFFFFFCFFCFCLCVAVYFCYKSLLLITGYKSLALTLFS